MVLFLICFSFLFSINGFVVSANDYCLLINVFVVGCHLLMHSIATIFFFFFELINMIIDSYRRYRLCGAVPRQKGPNAGGTSAFAGDHRNYLYKVTMDKLII